MYLLISLSLCYRIFNGILSLIILKWTFEFVIYFDQILRNNQMFLGIISINILQIISEKFCLIKVYWGE